MYVYICICVCICIYIYITYVSVYTYRPAMTRAYMRACLLAQKTCALLLMERAAAAESGSSDEMT